MELHKSIGGKTVLCNVETAELIKYASNAFLSTKISFVNAVAQICEAAGADVTQVAKGMGMDKRIGNQFLSAGLGYGGSCFGKDASCLISTAEKLGYDFKLLREVVEVNAQQPRWFVGKMRGALGSLEGKTVGVLGLAFKANTDDLRDAKSLEIIAQLLADGAAVKTYDPIAMDNTRKVFPHIEYCDNAYQVAAGADAVVVVTEWNEFKFLDLARLKETMSQPIIFDGRNIYDPERMRRLGFEYHSVGRPPVKQKNTQEDAA